MSDVIENRCIVCSANEIYGDFPVCQACQEKQDKLEKTVIEKFRKDSRFDRQAVADEFDAPMNAVNWYVYKAAGKQPGQLATDNLTINERIFGKYIWVEVGGKIDSMNAETLKSRIDELIEGGWENMVLELSKVAFFSSTGIRVVLATYKQLNGGTKSFNIENPSENVKNVLGLVALDSMVLK